MRRRDLLLRMAAAAITGPVVGGQQALSDSAMGAALRAAEWCSPAWASLRAGVRRGPDVEPTATFHYRGETVPMTLDADGVWVGGLTEVDWPGGVGPAVVRVREG